ncbi:MAG: YkgJ family cysteine cluster protein [Chitinophagales bacterium]|nr:YkgJ family cysteine cluster protein [Chitinophagales bacterium]
MSDLENEIAALKQQALQNKKKYTRLTQQLKKLKPYDVDELFHTQHDFVFSEIDCLQCANCCKTTPALVSNDDINRIANHLRISPKDVVAKYVTKDSDGDTVLNKTPCSFLNADNTCSIYEVRPFACKDYPHTHRKKMQTILNLTVKNAEICPAVARILNQLSDDLLE